jgi:hypothetical protein
LLVAALVMFRHALSMAELEHWRLHTGKSWCSCFTSDIS